LSLGTWVGVGRESNDSYTPYLEITLENFKEVSEGKLGQINEEKNYKFKFIYLYSSIVGCR
jgi:hypothetical protein